MHVDLNKISRWLDDLLSATFHIHDQKGYQNCDSADKPRGWLLPDFLLSRDWYNSLYLRLPHTYMKKKCTTQYSVYYYFLYNMS